MKQSHTKTNCNNFFNVEMRVGVGHADAVFRAADPLRAVCRSPSVCWVLFGAREVNWGTGRSVGVWVSVDSGSPVRTGQGVTMLSPYGSWAETQRTTAPFSSG